MRNDEDWYISLEGASIWDVYDSLSGIFRGGGNQTSPKLVKQSGLRERDFTFWTDEKTGTKYVLPDVRTGLSFSDSIERLANLRPRPLRGYVWKIPKGTAFPSGLCVNYDKREVDHPMVGPAYRMTVDEFTAKLKLLAGSMVPTNKKF